MRKDFESLGDPEPVLVYIARRLKESLALEQVFTAAGIDYCVEPDQYVGGFLFRTERTGAFFYVPSSTLQASYLAMEQNGYTPYREA